jgi:hypothetical protein
MPLLATRRLYLWRCDLTRSAWYAGAPVPAPALPADVRQRWLTRQDWEANPQCLPTDAQRVRERFAAGGRCFVLEHADGTLLYHLWVSRAGTWIDWIDARVAPPPNGTLVFDVWTREDRRGGVLHLIGAAQACEAARDWQAPWIAAGVEAHEVLPFARMYAHAGIGLIEPYDVLTWYQLLGFGWHGRAAVPAELRDRTAALGRRAKAARP